MIHDEENGDWQSWRRYVIETLRAIHQEQRNQGERIEALRVELAVLKVKAGFWGALAGVLTAVAVVIGDVLIKRF
jgi:hypothetical protein